MLLRRLTPFILSAIITAACAGAPTEAPPSAAAVLSPMPGTIGSPVAMPVDPTATPTGPQAPPIESDVWINTPPLNWASLRGKVTLVEFWTFECINCQHVFPIMRSLYADYHDQAFTLIGVHSPELSAERIVENVKRAVKDEELRYPIAIDNDFANWNRYHNLYWPAWYLVDKRGLIRYTHAGEGGEDETRAWIDKLLAE